MSYQTDFLEKELEGIAILFDLDIKEAWKLFNETENYTVQEFKCESLIWPEGRAPKSYEERWTYIMMGAAMVFIIIASFLIPRKNLWLDKFHGRPSIPVPVNLLQAQSDRLIIVLCFCLFAVRLVKLVKNDMPFQWDAIPTYLNTLMDIIASMFFGIICYPFFITSHSKHPILYILGTLYTLGFTAQTFAMEGLPCINYSPAEMAAWCLTVFPAYLIKLALCFIFPLQLIRYWRLEKKLTGKFLNDNKELYQVQHVRQLLCQNKPKGQMQEKKLMALLNSRFYHRLPGFRYSAAILSAIVLSIFLMYWISGTIFIKLFEERTPIMDPIWKALKLKNPTYLYRAGLLPMMKSFRKFVMPKYAMWDVVKEISYLLSCIFAAFVIGLITAFLVTSFSVLLTLRSYRSLLLDLYKGNLRNFSVQERTPKECLVSSAEYIGYQIGYAVWGFTIQAVCFIILSGIVALGIIVIFRYHQYFFIIGALKRSVPWMIYMMLVKLVLNLLAKFCFLLKAEDGTRVLAVDNRRAFFNFSYFMIFINVPLGFFSCILRVVRAMFFGIWILPRLDMSTLNRHFESHDGAFSAFEAFLMVENAHTNPIMVVFVNLLLESTRDLSFAGRLALHQYFIPKEGFKKPKTTKVEQNRRKRARTRWHLALTLHNNPELRRHRAGNSNSIAQEEEVEVPLDPMAKFLEIKLNSTPKVTETTTTTQDTKETEERNSNVKNNP